MGLDGMTVETPRHKGRPAMTMMRYSTLLGGKNGTLAYCSLYLLTCIMLTCSRSFYSPSFNASVVSPFCG